MESRTQSNCSDIGPRLFGRRAARASSRHPALLAVVCAAMMLGAPKKATTHEDPTGCSGNPQPDGISVIMGPDAQTFDHGDTVEYFVEVSTPLNVCNNTDVEVRFWAPDNPPDAFPDICGSTNGTVIVTGLSLPFGTSHSFTSADNAAMSYVLSHADENPIGVFTAHVCATGTSHVGVQHAMPTDEAAIPNNVQHGACCQPCVDNCVNDVSEDECNDMGWLYQGDGTTCDDADVDCTPPDCSVLNNACNEGVCNTDTGLCESDASSDTTICREGSGDLCDPDEFCTGVADDPCPPDVVAPLSTPCEADGDLCTNDHCDGDGQCVLDFVTICDDPVCAACNPVNGGCEPINPLPAGCGTVCCLAAEDDDEDDGEDDDGDSGDGDDGDDGDGGWGGRQGWSHWGGDDDGDEDDDDADDEGPEPAINCVVDQAACVDAGATLLVGTCTEPEACCFPVEDDDDTDDDDGEDDDGEDADGEDDEDDGDDDDGSSSICLDIDPLCCGALGGTPLGPGSQCIVDDGDDDGEDEDGQDEEGDDEDDDEEGDDEDDDEAGDDDDLRCPEPLGGKATSSGGSQADTVPVSGEANSPGDSFVPPAGGCGGLGMINLSLFLAGLVGLRLTLSRYSRAGGK